MNFKLLPQNKDKRQQVLGGVLIVVLLTTLIFSYFSFWRSSPPTANPISNQGMRLEKVIEDIDFDSDFLKTTHFQDLEDYGNWPLEIGDKGRANPFVPYSQ